MNVNYRVLGLDPGGTTGWSCYDAEFVQGELIEQRLTVGHIGPDQHHVELYDFLEDRHIQNFAVACESFEFRQGKHRDNINLISREYIGVVKLVCLQRGIKLKMYTAGQSKSFVPDKGPMANKKLKVMGWYNPGWKHANDATRVVVNYLVNVERRFDLVECWRDLV
jgi:Holliday junction resolvasome RuvABC endonuclease subunit